MEYWIYYEDFGSYDGGIWELSDLYTSYEKALAAYEYEFRPIDKFEYKLTQEKNYYCFDYGHVKVYFEKLKVIS